MLNMNPVVRVNVSIGKSTVSVGVFDVGAILTPTAGSGTALTPTSRFAKYRSLDEVLNGVTGVKPSFANTTDVYKAAEKFFGVSPAPAELVVIYYAGTPETPAAYSSTSTYAVGDKCTHDTKTYECTTAITEAEEWNADHWTEITLVADTPVTALLDAIDKGAEFYGVYYSPASGETESTRKTNLAAIVSALESLNMGVLFYGVTGTKDEIIADNGIVDTMKEADTSRAIGMACTSALDDAMGLMGVAMGYAHHANERSFALCYKPIATAAANKFTQAEVEAINGANANVHVSRTKNHTGLETGVVASGLRFDDILYLDKMIYDIQNGIYDLIASSDSKLPQNDTTTTLFISEINRVLENYFNIGVLDLAEWKGNRYDRIAEGAIFDHGYYVFADSFDLQSVEDRAAHKAMPITICLCLAGSVESVEITMDVQT